MTNQSSESTRYMIQVGRNRFRRDTWEAMKDICAVEGTRLADEIWCAMDAHVKEYASSNGVKDSGDGRIHMTSAFRKLEPDMSMPEDAGNVFDNLVDETVAKATQDVVEEVVEDERTQRGRMAGSDMFGRFRKQ
jgi:hypothetical protein